jgi:nitric oxide reductase subunit B
MTHATQKEAYPYFVLAVLLFALQLLFGFLTILKYIWPDPLLQILPFNTTRAIHINLLVFWLLLGFMGGTYYLIPEESDTELYSPALARVQFWILAVGGVAAVAGYVLGFSWGMPVLEQPTPIKIAIVVAALIFLFNVLMTVMKTGHWTAIQGVLIGGMVFLAVMFLFGIVFMKNLATQYYFWWWVIHLWVEGAWELITGSIMAFLLLKLTGIERGVVEKWLYAEVALVLFTGILGTGHHYYWIGTPTYWYWWGGIFSALEPLPILFMVMDTMRHVREKKVEIKNRVALHWAVGGTWAHFIGAGVWGFAHTLPQINMWTHGTQVTASHGHMAFFGAYATVNLTMMYYALPKLKQMAGFAQGRGLFAFWGMIFGMFLMGLSLAVAGVVQTYFNRVIGIDFLTTQDYMRLWFMVTLASAVIFATGAGTFIYDFFALKEERA